MSRAATPALIHRGVCARPTPEWFEAQFAANGWGISWRNGIYDYQHYHSNTHEALGVYGGRARMQLGGPAGAVHEVIAGDCVVIAAGCAHCRIWASPDFAVVGAYPGGARPDLIRGNGDARLILPPPEADPILGAGRGFAAC